MLFALLISGQIVVGELPVLEVVLTLAISALLTAIAWRFGLLVVASMIFAYNVQSFVPLTTDLSTWYAPQALLGLAILAGLGLFGFVTSRAGEPVFGRRFIDD